MQNVQETLIRNEKNQGRINLNKVEKKLTVTEQNRIKRFERKVREGKLGRFINWFDFMKEKTELTIRDFEYYKFPFGRIGNKIYTDDIDGDIYLYYKFKNATKAKRFMEGVE